MNSKDCIRCKYYKNYYKSSECYCAKGYCVKNKNTKKSFVKRKSFI